MDFTLKVYRELLATLLKGGYSFQTFEGFLESPGERVVILRHDMDLRPGNSLVTAIMEHDMGIRGTYYFRAVPESFDERIIRRVSELGHEVGYHYESMVTVGKRFGGWQVRGRFRKGDGKKNFSEDAHISAAYDDFEVNLERLRELVPVRTVAMHGSPRSRFNNLDMWKRHDYRDLGIIGEPYLDVDFSDVLYLTDTGRRWDGASVSVRDRVESGFSGPEFVFRSTHDIIAAAEAGRLPSRILINVHPQRWTGSFVPWVRELVWQNIKNVAKAALIRTRG